MSDVTTATADDGEFLTAEQLRDRTRFTFQQRSLLIPELGGRVPLHELSVGQRESLSSRLPDAPKNWQLKHTAMTLAEYVESPDQSTDWWTETIRPWPASALDRINREINDILNTASKEEAAAGVEFPASDD
jgi:hypothetical protein